MKLHLVMGEISCAQAGKHQWASMNETSHPRACDQISCGSEVWGAALSPKGMQNYQTKKKKKPCMFLFQIKRQNRPAWGERPIEGLWVSLPNCHRAKADINASGAATARISSSSFWKHWHWRRTFSSLKQRIQPMEAAQDGMGREETMRRMCVPLTTPGAQNRQKHPWKITSSWEVLSAQLPFPITVSPSSFKARFCGFHKFAGWRKITSLPTLKKHLWAPLTLTRLLGAMSPALFLLFLLLLWFG